MKKDEDWLIGLLKREIEKYKNRNNKNKHNYDNRINLLEKTIKNVETDFD